MKAAQIVLLSLAVGIGAKEHFDLDDDGVVGIDEFAVVSYAENGLSKGELGEIIRIADANSNGVLEVAELGRAKTSLGKIATEKAAEWLKDNDIDRDGRLSRREFEGAVSRKIGLGRRDVAEMWKMAEKDHDGVISYGEAREALYLLRTKAILEANKMLQKYDSDKNGKLSEDEAILMGDVAFDVNTEDALDAFERVARNEEEIGSSLMEGLMESLRETALDQVEERIREVDLDGDGYVAFPELRKRYKKKKASLLKKLFKRVDVNKDSALSGPEWVTLITEMSKIKTRKAGKSERVIHVLPSTRVQFQGAAREDGEMIREKRDTPLDKKPEDADEIVFEMKEWDGVMPTASQPSNRRYSPSKKELSPSVEPADKEFRDFQRIDVVDDNIPDPL